MHEMARLAGCTKAGRRWHTREELRLAIVVRIERTYHRRRRQRALGKLTPIEFEAVQGSLMRPRVGQPEESTPEESTEGGQSQVGSDFSPSLWLVVWNVNGAIRLHGDASTESKKLDRVRVCIPVVRLVMGIYRRPSLMQAGALNWWFPQEEKDSVHVGGKRAKSALLAPCPEHLPSAARLSEQLSSRGNTAPRFGQPELVRWV
jgi:hypothetical protein